MNKVITLVLVIGLSVSAVGFFLYETMWDKAKVKDTETHKVIDETDVPRS